MTMMKIVRATCNCTEYTGNAHAIPQRCGMCNAKVKIHEFELVEMSYFPFVDCVGKNQLYDECGQP